MGQLDRGGIRANENVHPIVVLPQLAHLDLLEVFRVTKSGHHVAGDEEVALLARLLFSSRDLLILLIECHRLLPRYWEIRQKKKSSVDTRPRKQGLGIAVVSTAQG